MEQTSITIKDLIDKRHELEKECRHKTSIIKMREITKNFLSQQGITDEDRIEAVDNGFREVAAATAFGELLRVRPLFIELLPFVRFEML